ncbi:MAG: hypothetical protein GXP49_18875 [Deltaproteobacteria bacterium]|nr:hypothetical protein [Deltaproteobacteria bacterium]
MYDSGKVITGLLAFAVLVTLPFWYTAAGGKGGFRPEPKLAPGLEGKKCVESKAFMRASHMDLLNLWRDEVVRQDLRVHFSPDGRAFEKSLTNTCLKCHSNTGEFCDRCHNYVGVQPYCWDCHMEKKLKGAE